MDKQMRDIVAECLPEKDHFMAAAWVGLVHYAAGNDEMIAQFEKDTGRKFSFPGGIEGMVDKATGYREDLVFAFAHWVTENLWGDSGVNES